MKNHIKLIREIVGGEPYEYYPLGHHIVCAPGICRGRPTFKYTRIDVRHALSLLAEGRTVEQVAKGYELPVEAVQEAVALAGKAFEQQANCLAKSTKARLTEPRFCSVANMNQE